MDPTILQYGQVERLRTALPAPSHVLQFFGDMAEVIANASTYFETIHTWMPIISKKRFYDHHLQPTFYFHADITLLLLSMKLITSMLPDELANPRTPAYNAAKHFYLEIEASGVMSIQVLQAGLLLSLYELGHAIYPSAYLSIGACARYAYALGINKDANIQVSKVLTLVELEENRRVWWGIVILDRFEFSHLLPLSKNDSALGRRWQFAMIKQTFILGSISNVFTRFLNIGCPGRPFATGNPTLQDPLPADDAAWDAGVSQD
jgi:hypothetical protein